MPCLSAQERKIGPPAYHLGRMDLIPGDRLTAGTVMVPAISWARNRARGLLGAEMPQFYGLRRRNLVNKTIIYYKT
jgi:hypothetical protein